MNHAYPNLIARAIDDGEKLNPRGFICRELRPFHFSILDPKRSIYQGKSRKLSARFWAIETLSYLAGMGEMVWHAELLVYSNKGMKAFQNSNGKFDGAYGPKIRKGIDVVIDILMNDPDSRQGICTIWGPNTKRNSKDVPCTVMLHFFRSKGALHLQVYMRSNDLNWGLPYDVPAFCAIQKYVAFCLGWEVGHYHHSCGSLHVYENETGEKGQPGPPVLSINETYENRIVPTVTGVDWIEPALRRVYCHYSNYQEWPEIESIPEPWRTMIHKGSWIVKD